MRVAKDRGVISKDDKRKLQEHEAAFQDLQREMQKLQTHVGGLQLSLDNLKHFEKKVENAEQKLLITERELQLTVRAAKLRIYRIITILKQFMTDVPEIAYGTNHGYDFDDPNAVRFYGTKTNPSSTIAKKLKGASLNFSAREISIYNYKISRSSDSSISAHEGFNLALHQFINVYKALERLEVYQSEEMEKTEGLKRAEEGIAKLIQRIQNQSKEPYGSGRLTDTYSLQTYEAIFKDIQHRVSEIRWVNRSIAEHLAFIIKLLDAARHNLNQNTLKLIFNSKAKSGPNKNYEKMFSEIDSEIKILWSILASKAKKVESILIYDIKIEKEDIEDLENAFGVAMRKAEFDDEVILKSLNRKINRVKKTG